MSSDVAIEVKGLGKRFEIGPAAGGYMLLTEQITERFRRRGRRAEEPGVLGTSGHRLRGEARRDLRRDRPQRGRQEHPAQDSLPDHPADQRRGPPAWPGRCSARGRHRIPSRAHRPRERLPERRDPRHEADRHPAALRRDRRVRRHRPLHRHTGEALLERHAAPPRLLGCSAPRAGDPDHRRGPLGRRRRLPAEVPRPDGGRLREGRTVVFISHNLASVRNLCDRAHAAQPGTLQGRAAGVRGGPGRTSARWSETCLGA